MSFEFEKQNIEDVILVKPKVFGDNRGFFMESYQKSAFAQNGIDVEFNQDNHSKSTKGVLRGLHYQKNPKAQAKLVRCSRGNILDVAVNLDIVKKAGAWFSFNDEKLGQGRDKAKEYLNANPELLAEVEKLVREKLAEQ